MKIYKKENKCIFTIISYLYLCINSNVFSEFKSGYFEIFFREQIIYIDSVEANSVTINFDFSKMDTCSRCIEEVDLTRNKNEVFVGHYGIACIDSLGLDYVDRSDTTKLDSIFKINNNKVSKLNYMDTLKDCFHFVGYMVVKTYEGYYVHIVLVFYDVGATFSYFKYYWWYDTDFISPIIHNSKQKYVDPIKIIKMKEGLELSWQPFPGYINLCLYNPHGIKLKSYELGAQSGKKFLDYGKMSLGQGVYFLRVKPSNRVFTIFICK